MALIKICGTTSPEDARLATDAGADFIGMVVEHPASPRHISAARAHEISPHAGAPLVLVTVNRGLDELVTLAQTIRPAPATAGAAAQLLHQLHGDESPELVRALKARGYQVWKVLSGSREMVLAAAAAHRAAGADAILLDARETTPEQVVYGGTGRLADWDLAAELVRDGHRLVLAGGLDAGNVARAIAAVEPWAVDAVSGVEAAKGQKSAAKVRAFVAAARAATP